MEYAGRISLTAGRRKGQAQNRQVPKRLIYDAAIAKVLTLDEASRIAPNIAKLPELPACTHGAPPAKWRK